MSETRKPVMSGGCQCGAVRYALYATPTHTSICWCRMCQKAVGSYFAPFTGVPRADFAWTRGSPGTFASSGAAERDFCRECGTPLTYRNVTADRISVTVGSLDAPYAVKPEQSYGIEHKPAFGDSLGSLPGIRTDGWIKPEVAPNHASRQHPDHDT